MKNKVLIKYMETMWWENPPEATNASLLIEQDMCSRKDSEK